MGWFNVLGLKLHLSKKGGLQAMNFIAESKFEHYAQEAIYNRLLVFSDNTVLRDRNGRKKVCIGCSICGLTLSIKSHWQGLGN